MKILKLHLLIIFLGIVPSFGQSSSIRNQQQIQATTADLTKVFDKSFGGSMTDNHSQLLPTPDGGYIFAGYSESGQTGDKSAPLKGLGDYWVIKLNASGAKVWDKSLGGKSFNYFGAMQLTADGGYLLAGYSDSGISGDKTQASRGGSDFWIIKIDGSGNKVWDKGFGGIGYEYLSSVQATLDGGFLLGGYTDSGIGGDKTQASQGGSDYWVVKIDASGNKIWDKTFGGSGAETLTSMLSVADGFLLGGYSNSPVSGDKSQTSQGGNDYWLVKIDASGNKVWDKTFGGSAEDYLKSIQVGTNGNYFLGGYSYSGLSGDKTQNSQGGADFWLIKINSTGSKIFDTRLGGSSDDQLSDLKLLSNGQILLAGSSSSGISGDKSQATQGGNDFWIVKLDSTGTKIFDRDFGGLANDNVSSLQINTDGSLAVGGSSTSGITGDKTQASQGAEDYWMMKLQNCQLSNPTITSSGGTNNCIGNSLTLSSNASNVSYQWTKDGANFSTLANITASSSGVYSLTITDSQGCKATASNPITITFGSLPTSTISTTTPTTFCTGGSVLLTTNTVSGYTYQWAKDGAAISGATSNTYLATLGGAYTVTISNGSTCTSTSSATTVTVAPAPTIPSISQSVNKTSICQGDSIILYATKATNLNYQWVKDNVPVASTTSGVVLIYTLKTSGDYYLKVSDSLGCSSSSPVTTYTVSPLPNSFIVAESSTQFCKGGNVVLLGPSGNGYTYQWYKDNGMIIGATGQTWTATELGNYDLMVTALGCSNRTSSPTFVQAYNLPNAPTINSGGTGFVCSGTAADLVANTTETNLSYQWYKEGILLANEINQHLFTGNAGNYTVRVTNANNCSSTSDKFFLSVNPVATSVITPLTSTTVCAGQTISLQGPTYTGYTYQWLKDGQIIPSANAQNYNPSTSGNISLVIISDKNCASTSNPIKVIFNPLPAQPTITTTGLLTFCRGGSTRLYTTSTHDVLFDWLKNNVSTGISDSVITVNSEGTFVLKATYPATGCSSISNSLSTSFYTSADKSITLTGGPSLCAGSTITLSVPSVIGQTYQWYQNNVAITTAKSSTLSVTDGGNYLVKITTNNGCVDTSAITSLTLYPLPTAPIISANGPTNICSGDSVTLQIPSLPGGKYQWYSDNLSTLIPGATNSTYTVKVNNAYGAKITDSNGCSSFSNNFVPITVITVPKPTITQNDAVLNSSATTGNQWFYNGVEIANATSQQLKLNGSGKYAVQASFSGCKSPFSDDFIPVITATEETVSVKIFPNPAVESIHISTPIEVQVYLIDQLGRKIVDQTISSDTELQVQHLARGMYFVELSSKSGARTVKKIILQ